MRVVFGSDHAGYALKEELKDHVAQMGHEVIDVGAHSTQRADYPQYGREAAQVVAAGDADRAILVCGTGVGISLAANTVEGVRCAVCSEPYTAKLTRNHNDANAIALGARVVGPGEAQMIAEVFLGEDFEGGRHQTRIDMVNQMKAGK